jgi:predicted nuclease with TOPRIM domain
MNKSQLQTIKDAVSNLGNINSKFDSLVAEAIGEIDKEIENLGNLVDELQDEFDDLPEKAQEGEKGTELEESIKAIGEAKSDLEDSKDELEAAPMDDIITKLEEIVTK